MHKLVTNAAELKQTWQQASPFAHLILDDILHEETLISLLEALSEENFELKNSDLFTFYQTNDLNGSTSKEIQQLKKFLTAPPVIDALKNITGKNIDKKIDLHATIYEDTHHLLCHDDDLEGRALAFIIYLTDVDEQEGGTLMLYNVNDGQPTDVAKNILPQAGRMVIFGVQDGSWHAVSEVLGDVQRIALAGWYYANE